MASPSDTTRSYRILFVCLGNICRSPAAEGIMQQYKAGKPLAAICAAPLVYGRMGLLKGLKATCYPGFEENLEGASYTSNLVEEDGLFITGKGPAAVFEFGYAIVAKLAGKDKAEAVRNGMLYNEVAR